MNTKESVRRYRTSKKGKATLARNRAARVADGRAATKKYRKRNREIIDAAKDNPCMDCGESYPPYVMDFDHVRGVKLFNVGRGLTKPTAMVLAEIEKCDLVCSNCHRGRTHRGS